jgi:hypothetical protein
MESEVSTSVGSGVKVLVTGRLSLLTFRHRASYIYRTTAPLTSRCCILYIYSTNINTNFFKHGAMSPPFLFKMLCIL